jgi:hypothetical protein
MLQVVVIDYVRKLQKKSLIGKEAGDRREKGNSVDFCQKITEE